MTPAEIAKKLTPAQARALRAVGAGQPHDLSSKELTQMDDVLGLICYDWSGIHSQTYLYTLGLAVLAALDATP